MGACAAPNDKEEPFALVGRLVVVVEDGGTSVRSAACSALRSSRMVCLIADDTNHHAGWFFVTAAGGLAAIALAIFGLPPVAIHGPLHYLGIMDPLCGMTRATRLFARGDLPAAWRYNPASFLVAALALLILTRGAVGRLTDRWWRVSADRRLVGLAVVLLVGVLEINQQLHASLLR